MWTNKQRITETEIASKITADRKLVKLLNGFGKFVLNITVFSDFCHRNLGKNSSFQDLDLNSGKYSV